MFDCTEVPSPPFAVEDFPITGDQFLSLDGEGLGFRPTGEMVLPVELGTPSRTFSRFVAVGVDGAEVERYPIYAGSVRDLAIRPDGILAAARWGGVSVYSPSGTEATFDEDVEGERVHADLSGRIWVTDTDAGTISMISADGEFVRLLAGGPAAGARGAFFDDARSRLYFGVAPEGRVRHAELSESGALVEIGDTAVIPDVYTSSMTLDVCNNLYVAGEFGTLHRVHLDEEGVATEEPLPVLSADTNINVRRVAFARGSVFDPMSLYVRADQSQPSYRSFVGRLWVGVPGLRSGPG